LNNLAILLNKTGRGEISYQILSHAVRIMRRELDIESPALSDGIYNLANVAAETGREGEAMRLHRTALNIRENAGITPDIVNSLHSLAALYEDRNDKTRSIRYAETARTRAVGTEAYIGACYYLANLYEKSDKNASAIPLYAEVLRWIVSKAGRGHSAYGVVAARLAGVLSARQEYGRALSLWRVICDSIADNNSGRRLFYANGLRSQAILHERLNEPAAAAELMLKAIKIKMRIMGRHAHDIPDDTLFLIDMYMREGRLSEAAEAMVLTLMRTGTGQEGDEGKTVLEPVLNALADTYVRAGNDRFDDILNELVKLGDRRRLWEIVKKWTAWAAQED
jgi:tetratricopeptide (TPR) repeat protein